MERMTINQPSRLQPLHKYDGLHVIADVKGNAARVWPVSGNIISMEVLTNCLSKGWIGKGLNHGV